jgi:predicted outer membrane repeat protein
MARGLAVAVVALLIAASSAQAASGTFTCPNLQAGINQAVDGDVITVDGVCTGQFNLKNFGAPGVTYATWTLQGVGGDDGFDRNNVSGRALTGTNTHRLVIQDLTFRDSSVTGAGQSGGAIEVTGESGLQVFNSRFFNNHANNRGGAIHVAAGTPTVGFNNLGVSMLGNVFGSTTVPSEGNSATIGGAVSVESPGVNDQFSLTDNLFANNVAISNGGAFDFELAPAGGANVSLNGNQVIANRAGGSGGGGYLDGPIGFLNIDNELYENNSVEPVTGYPAGDHFGGGLFLGGGLPDLRHNVFQGNAVKEFPDGGNLGGGGLAVLGPGINAQSEYSRIEGNTVAAPKAATQFEAEGGGLFFSGDDGRWQGFLDAIAGNSVGDRGEGGGIYVGAAAGPTSLELAEVTVAGNSVGTGGQFAGIAGDLQDDLQLWNSIVYTGGAGDIGGFDSFDIQYSDACTTAGGVFGGPGNICADPKLAGGPAGVRQTALSPTIDKGSDELFNMVGGERANEDYEGDPRPTDGDGDGHTVDMGADESPAFVAPPPPPPPTPQCSDHVDNDGDGAIDAADPGCLPGPTDNNEGDETARDLVLCGQRQISLVRADVRGSKVVLSGIVATSLAGQKVQLTVRYLGQTGKAQKLGSVTPGADGQFQARVKKPTKKLFNDARYQAKVGTAKSVELKLPQSLASSSLKQAAGATLEVRGQVDRALLGKRNPVVIKRILCGKYTTVGQARPNKKGTYVVRFPSPASQGSALYRAETKVLARPGSKRYVKQFARAIGITF